MTISPEQKNLLLALFEKGIISFDEARNLNLLRLAKSLKALRLVSSNSHGYVIIREGIKVAFAHVKI